MRHTVLATAAALLLSTAAFAQMPSTALTPAASGNYVLDTSHANVIFNIGHMGFSRYFGRFNTLNGTLAFDAEHPENSKLAITIDVDSIDTNNAKLEGELKSSQWFDTAQHPKATFTSTRVEKLTDTTGKLYGDLTLHGITKSVVLDVTFNGSGMKPKVNVQALGFSAQGQINRSEFGISQYIPMVGDTVALTIEVEFHKE